MPACRLRSKCGPKAAWPPDFPARRRRQVHGIPALHGQGITQGYVRVRRISGNNPFLAYGVANDAGAPGERSGDGAYVPVRQQDWVVEKTYPL